MKNLKTYDEEEHVEPVDTGVSGGLAIHGRSSRPREGKREF